MRPFRDIPIRRKLLLVIMLISSMGLVFAGTAIILYERSNFGQRVTEELSSLAEIIGTQSVAAMAFSDPKAAEENLAALKAKPDIAAAGLYDSDGKIFAQYRRSDLQDMKLPLRPDAEGEYSEDGYLNIVRVLSTYGFDQALEMLGLADMVVRSRKLF